MARPVLLIALLLLALFSGCTLHKEIVLEQVGEDGSYCNATWQVEFANGEGKAVKDTDTCGFNSNDYYVGVKDK